MARKRTILSPVIPRATRAKAPTAAELAKGAEEWRSRPTLPGPFGDDEAPYCSASEAEVRARAEVDTAGGMAPIVERRTKGVGWQPARKVPTVAELAELGHARALERNASGAGTVWEIKPEGYRLLHESMTR